eukprot:TRINITY_DN3564_c0_g2_i1.p3 TRINITY_DN3564_c0_g2~~TRINITY_DN3564_c0_g2_i1.p3  ORF type:complete len:305 (+),score=114.82 TRINITY_DN3564_c0_g2_i1:2726-3640(+)
MATMSKAALLLLFGTCASGLSDVEISNIDRISPPSFVTESVTFSFNMNCMEVACFSRVDQTPGTFDRATFASNFMTAMNTHSSEVNTAAGNPTANAWTMMSTNFVWDRVVESTAPFDPTTVELVDGSTETEPNYWNVFVRFTVTEVPVEVAEDVKIVIAKLYTSYPGINYNSVWISTDAAFISNQLEPVKGRGHKDQKLLIPLIMGIVFMYLIPTLVTFFLVRLAQGHNKADQVIEGKQKIITEQHTVLTERKTALSSFETTEKDRAKAAAHEVEMKRLKDAAELTNEDVDWDAQNVQNQPFGN